jgi:hypothetical protein
MRKVHQKGENMRVWIASTTMLFVACGQPSSGQEGFAKVFLNDPDSAQFRNVFQSGADKTVWCGELNAKNRMGGMVGFTRYVLQTPDPALGIDPTVDVADAKILATLTLEGTDGFDGKWSIWCRG